MMAFFERANDIAGTKMLHYIGVINCFLVHFMGYCGNLKYIYDYKNSLALLEWMPPLHKLMKEKKLVLKNDSITMSE